MVTYGYIGSTVNFRDSMGVPWPSTWPHHQPKSTDWTDTPGSWHMFERIAPIHQAPGATGERWSSGLMFFFAVELYGNYMEIIWSMTWTVNFSEEFHGNKKWKSSVSWGFLTALGVKTLGFILLHKDVQPWKIPWLKTRIYIHGGSSTSYQWFFQQA